VGGVSSPKKDEKNEIGNKYFLSTIWIAGEGIGREAPKSRAERELERSEALHLTEVAPAQPVAPCHCGL